MAKSEVNLYRHITKYEKQLPYVIAATALLLFVPFLGNVHLFDWDEINFAESAREMLVSGNFLRVQIDFQPFWEKPPLFFWLQALCMKVFGVNEFAARFPNVLVGVATLLSFYFLGKRLYNAAFGLLWCLVYVGSFTPHLYFKSGIIDPLFNLLMFWSVVNLSPSPSPVRRGELNDDFSPSPNRRGGRGERSFYAALFAGLAVWTKGPVGIGIPVIVLGVVWVLNRFRPIMSFKSLLIFTLTSGIMTLGWIASIIIESGWDTFLAFLQYLYNLLATSEADHGEPFYYHFLVVLIGCFPMSVIALVRVIKSRKSQVVSIVQSQTSNIKHQTSFQKTMLVLFWVVMIVFSLVKTKIVHYSSMAYFPLSFLAAQFLYEWVHGKIQWFRWTSWLMIFIGTILCLVLTLLPIIGMNPSLITPYLDDDFAVANLQASVHWVGYEWLIGVVYWLCIVVAIIIWNKQKIKAILLLLTSTALCMFVYTAVVVPKIEGYSQRTTIEFYESKRGQDVYVWPIGFKSYAQYFYFQKPKNQRPESSNEEWLLNGKVDKTTYLISRIDRADAYRKNTNLEVIEEKNGFVIFKRK